MSSNRALFKKLFPVHKWFRRRDHPSTPKAKHWSISKKLNIVNFAIIVSGSLGIIGAIEMNKGATLHELNFKHLKYNHIFNDLLVDIENGTRTLPELLPVLTTLHGHPAKCLDLLGKAERLLLELTNLGSAIELCFKDLQDSKEALESLAAYTQGVQTREQTLVHMRNALRVFRENSANFEPLASKAILMVFWIFITLVCTKALIVPWIGFTLSRSVKKDYNRLLLAEKAATLARDEAQTANEAKDDFLAISSHELRTPLNAIIGFTSLIEAETFGPVKNKKYKEYLGLVSQSAKHLNMLVDHLLDFSKLHAGNVKLSEKEFSLRQLLNGIIKTYQLTCKGKGLKFHHATKVSPNLKLIGDKNRLAQVILNLLDNAVKFTSTGGIHFIVTSYLNTNRTATVSIKIQDTGIGIEEPKLNSIFDKFTQVQTGYVKTNKGLGLGLSISAEILQNMNETLHVTSKVGEGSTFYFSVTLPIVDAKDKRQKTKETTKVMFAL